MAASKPTMEMSRPFNFFLTKILLGTLLNNLGCFPLDDEP